MRETKSLEFKSKVSNTFLKTVCAFANYDGGTIIFGVDDDGSVVGLENLEQVCMSIENKINDMIHPQPDYEMQIREKEKTVILTVKSGQGKPYTYKSKAYKRNDASTIEVDELELIRLILQGKNLNYEELPAENQDLNFSNFEVMAKREIGIKELSEDVLKSLNLFNISEGYNRAAALLADENDFPGIDLARFGDSINTILKRATFEKKSVLCELEQAVEVFRDYYTREEIIGMQRVQIQSIPEEAFRETIANALIHRTWDVKSHVRIMMFEDRIEVSSPGGLPPGLSQEEYLKGNISVLRNPILAGVFYRLHIIEALGTGIIKIKEAYKDSARKPSFEIFDNSINVILPVTDISDLTEDENAVYKVLRRNMPKGISEIVEEVPFGKSKATLILKELEGKQYVATVGNGRGTKYRAK